MEKRVPKFWRDQLVEFKQACKMVEEVYRRCSEKWFGGRMRWVKLLNCKDVKKRKMYLGTIVEFLSGLVEFFDGVVFDEILLRDVIYEVIEEALNWYKDYFVFSYLASVKIFELFERRVVKQYGSIERYIELKRRGNIKVRGLNIQSKQSELKDIELKSVDGKLFTF